MSIPGSASILLLPLLFASGLSDRSQGPGDWWVYFESRESRQGKVPSLVLRAKGGKSWELKASADATVIAYLEDRAFPRMVRLSVGTRDQNRALIRFELPGDLEAKDLEKAEMVLDLKLSKMAPSQKFELAVHRVLEPWKERSVTWARQPEISKETIRPPALEPRKQILRIDVRALVQSWLAKPDSNHGVLVRTAGRLLPKSPPKKQLIADLRAQVGFLAASDKALARAKKQGRLVLTLVVSSQGRGAASALEQLLLAQAFCSPEVLSLLEQHFVPLRLTYPPYFYTHQKVARGKDPLTALGTSCLKIKAPALLVSSAKGKLLDSLDSIGTPDELVVHRFLLRALAAAPPMSPVLEKGSKDLRLQEARAKMRLGDFAKATQLFEALVSEDEYRAEARYRLAALAWRRGEREDANHRFAKLSKNKTAGPWALRAAARLAWPERMAWAESLRDPGPLGKSSSTEKPVPADQVDVLVRRALLYLVEQQDPDGTWPTESAQYRMAVSAFAAKALLVWKLDADADLKDRMRKALMRFERRALTHVIKEDPKQASTFGATYLVDYFLEAHDRTKTMQSLARLRQSTRFLIGGQCPNGAWSYSYGFGTNWKGGFGGWPKTTRGRTHSMNTGPALDFLLAAKKAGAKVPDEALARGLDVLAKMRKAPGVFTYTYPDPISFQRSDQSIARGPTCELALYLGKKTSAEHLLTTLRRFMELRGSLRAPVKLDASWSSPHNFSSYFYFYAYYHAALAWKTLEPLKPHRKEARDALLLLRKDLLQVAEIDGTWIDFPQVGKPYATAAALLILALAR